MTTDDPGTGPAAAVRERFDQTQEVHLDLREPVSREEVGMGPGESDNIVERAGGGRFLDVEFTLPGDVLLDVPAIGVVFADAVGSLDNSPVERIIINRVEPDPAAARAALEAAVPVLGLDAQAVDKFFTRLRPDDAFGDQRVFTGPAIGYLSPTVEVIYSGRQARLIINYTLSWDPPVG